MTNSPASAGTKSIDISRRMPGSVFCPAMNRPLAPWRSGVECGGVSQINAAGLYFSKILPINCDEAHSESLFRLGTFVFVNRRNPELRLPLFFNGGVRRDVHSKRGRHGTVDLAMHGAEGLQPQRLSAVLRVRPQRWPGSDNPALPRSFRHSRRKKSRRWSGCTSRSAPAAASRSSARRTRLWPMRCWTCCR